MRIDWYLKTVLTIIGLALASMAVHAQAPASELQMAVTPVGYSFFDARTGDLWEYSGTGVHAKFKLNKPGLPLVKEK